MRPVYLDTNVFIAAFETNGPLSDSAWTVLDAVTRGEIKAHTSELAVAELLVHPYRLGSELLIELYTGLIAEGGMLSVIRVSRTILTRSARIRSMHTGVKLPDAIHIATALETGCGCFLTDDQRLWPLPSLPMVALDQDAFARIGELFR